MAKTLEKVTKVHVAEIVRHGEQITLPEKLSLDAAIVLLMQRKEYEQEEVVVAESFDVFPWDGAAILDEVLTKRYGWVPAKAVQTFFGPKPPALINIEVGVGQVRKVIWGQFQLPGVEGLLQTGSTTKDGRIVFQLAAKMKRMHEHAVQELFSDMREAIKTESIYRGKAIKIRFLDESGSKLEMPEPKFMDVGHVSEQDLVFSKRVEDAIRTNLFTPITRGTDLLANGIPIKRGVLLGGTYGTGKTMAALVAAKLAQEAGVTFVYVPRADELAQAIDFARMYQSPACVVFCEDIDRVMDGERDVAMDDILNIIDGIDSKQSHVIVVLTTNNLGGVNPAMLRPGRLDAVIEVLAPDADAVQRLIRQYGAGAIAPTEDLTEVGRELAGYIPAVIAEVVKRAKLAQLSLQAPGEKVSALTATALLSAAYSIQQQVVLIRKEPEAKKDTVGEAIREVVVSTLNGEGPLEGMRQKVDRIYRQVC